MKLLVILLLRALGQYCFTQHRIRYDYYHLHWIRYEGTKFFFNNLSLLCAVSVDSQSLCDTSTYLEVKEGRDNTFVCTGLAAAPNVLWLLKSQLLSTCDTTSCINDRYPQHFHISKASPTSSNITVHVTAFPSLDNLAAASLSCQQTSRVTCQLDVVCKYSLIVWDHT